ncbi:MAG: ABC transporter ATP-binding protein [Alphaproteobacteria bacterium]|nr:MAG: ABC transporter ATP-binding protein [Alphaproteobacteria bacterium]
MVTVARDEPMLEIRGLRVDLQTRKGPLRVLDDISLEVGRSEVLGVVGESGAGKSMTGAAVNGLLPAAVAIAGGEIRVNGRRVDNLPADDLRKMRGREVGTIFQDPMTSLNPLFRVGDQLVETMRAHLPMSRDAAWRRGVELLTEVGIAEPEQRMRHYPHQFSGGMRQRVVIALALCANPSLIIADEPTTALDVSVQSQILRLLKRLSAEHGTAIMLITHDMGVIAEMADRVAVLYAGRIAEVGPVGEVLQRPGHPYTEGLMGSIPKMGSGVPRLTQISGSMPRLGEVVPDSCPFVNRCNVSLAVCSKARPPDFEFGASTVACWRHEAAQCRAASNE